MSKECQSIFEDVQRKGRKEGKREGRIETAPGGEFNLNSFQFCWREKSLEPKKRLQFVCWRKRSAVRMFHWRWCDTRWRRGRFRLSTSLPALLPSSTSSPKLGDNWNLFYLVLFGSPRFDSAFEVWNEFETTPRADPKGNPKNSNFKKRIVQST